MRSLQENSDGRSSYPILPLTQLRSLHMFALAIDGQAGCGKSTVAKAVARRLDITYINTGAMYRALTLHVLRSGVDLEDRAAVAQVAATAEIDFATHPGTGEREVRLNGEFVAPLLQEESLARITTLISGWPEVRERLVRLQQEMAARQPVVMEGRDIGTVVLPHAPLKVFLTASAEARAQRRHKQLLAQFPNTRYEDVLAELQERDRMETTRAVAPLVAAADARPLDTSHLSPEQVTQQILDWAREAGALRKAHTRK